MVAAEGVLSSACACMCTLYLSTYACLEKPVSWRPSSRFHKLTCVSRDGESGRSTGGHVGRHDTAKEQDRVSPRRSAGAERNGGARVDYLGIPGAGYPGNTDTDEEACEERLVTETNDKEER